MTSQLQPALPSGSLLLITGGTGYVGSVTAHHLVEKGYRLRAPARSQAKADDLVSYIDKTFGKGYIESTPIIEDMSTPGCYDETVKGVDGIVHIAADVSLSTDYDNVTRMTKDGVVHILSAAAKEPSIKRIVLTSSSVTLGSPVSIPRAEFEKGVKKQTWDSSSFDDEMPKKMSAMSEQHKTGKLSQEEEGIFSFGIYSSSKILAEKFAWDFIKERKPQFTFTTVLPNAVWGKLVLDNKRASLPGDWLRSIATGDGTPMKSVPPQWMNNVHDVARAHVAAIADSTVGNERILAFSEPFGWNDVIDAIAKHRPDLASGLPERLKGAEDTVEGTDVKNKRFKDLCGGKLIGVEQSVKDTLEGLVPIKK